MGNIKRETYLEMTWFIPWCRHYDLASHPFPDGGRWDIGSSVCLALSGALMSSQGLPKDEGATIETLDLGLLSGLVGRLRPPPTDGSTQPCKPSRGAQCWM